MYLCYIDESGTPELPGNTSHFVLCGIAIPIWHWSSVEKEIAPVKYKYGLQDAEIHTGWLIRPYSEQKKVADFTKLPHAQRRSEVESVRRAELLRLQRSKNKKTYTQIKKNYRQTEPYIHLTYDERCAFIEEIATKIGNFGYARIFGECIDKIYFDPKRTAQSINEQAFEQVISRFERFLSHINANQSTKSFGLVIHDNNDTVAKKHTELMKKFHRDGTLWTQINNIIETPLFVDSHLTSTIQIADVCGYAIRRYLENGETQLFDHVFKRADQKAGKVVGVRHFTRNTCKCKICTAHRALPATSQPATDPQLEFDPKPSGEIV